MGRVVIESIFSPAHGHRGQLELTALRLEAICLLDIGGLLQRFLKLEALQHLQLMHCEDVDPLLSVLSHTCSDLESFALERYPYQHNSAVNDFVQATTPKRLILRLESEPERPAYIGAQGLVAFDTLSLFARSIQCLVLEDNNPNHHIWGPQRKGGSSLDFRGLCISFWSLHQLSVACPTIEKRHWAEHGFLDFVVSTYTFMRQSLCNADPNRSLPSNTCANFASSSLCLGRGRHMIRRANFIEKPPIRFSRSWVEAVRS
jgi:hypothetical protein